MTSAVRQALQAMPLCCRALIVYLGTGPHFLLLNLGYLTSMCHWSASFDHSWYRARWSAAAASWSGWSTSSRSSSESRCWCGACWHWRRQASDARTSHVITDLSTGDNHCASVTSCRIRTTVGAGSGLCVHICVCSIMNKTVTVWITLLPVPEMMP